MSTPTANLADGSEDTTMAFEPQNSVFEELINKPYPELPPELHDRIIELCKDDTSCLANLSLVKKEWSTICRLEFFDSINLKYAELLIPFLDTIESPLCTFRDRVQSFQLGPYSRLSRFREEIVLPRKARMKPKEINTALIKLAHMLPNLRHLSFDHFAVQNLTFAIRRSFKEAFANIKTLSLRETYSIPSNRTSQFISTFPRIRKLVCQETLVPGSSYCLVEKNQMLSALPDSLRELVLVHPPPSLSCFLRYGNVIGNEITTLSLVFSRTSDLKIYLPRIIGPSLTCLTLQKDEDYIDSYLCKCVLILNSWFVE
jgi:hypothetical protein